jgi:hypothetical protein
MQEVGGSIPPGSTTLGSLRQRQDRHFNLKICFAIF